MSLSRKIVKNTYSPTAIERRNLLDHPASKLKVHVEEILKDADQVDFNLVPDSFSGPIESKPIRLRAGSLCPNCKTHRLDYDGQINLACPECGVISGGCFT
jgi:hypothetical protein